MRRRSYDEIQTSEQIPEQGYDEYRYKDYSKLVPTYRHTSMKFNCNEISDTGSYIEVESDPNIYYNNIYSYLDSSVYHRDNYCSIPINVPAMSLQADTFGLSVEVVQDNVPKVSKNLELDYDSSFLVPSNSLMRVVLLAADDTSEALILDMLNRSCECTGLYKPNPCSSDECSSFIQPLDDIKTTIIAVSDEYAYSWPDLWDMSTLTTHSTKRYKPPTQQSSSSSSVPPAPQGAVYLCKIDTPPTGNGGSATVSIISVSGSGAVKVGGSIVVNVPSI